LVIWRTGNADPKAHREVVRALAAPDPSGKQTIHWADEPKGFGVLCSGVTSSKTYVVQRALKSGIRRRVTVGPCSVLTLADATEKAKLVLVEFYQGRDPKGARHEKITLREALENYFAARKSLAAETRRNYATNVRLYLQPWLDLPLKMITPEMVEARHRKIQQEVSDEHHDGFGTANQAMVVLRLIWNYTADRVVRHRGSVDRAHPRVFIEGGIELRIRRAVRHRHRGAERLEKT
jgi:hypothetical protein